MKLQTLLRITLFVLLLTIFLSCTEEEKELLQPLSRDTINAEVLWQRISLEEPYDNYSNWPYYEGENPGQAPHGRIHEIFINRYVSESIPVESKVLPIGSIIVKENFTSANELAAITVMAKIDNYNPEVGNWFWAKYNPDGSTAVSGIVEGCIQCHSAYKDNDYLIVHRLDKE